MTNPSTGPGTTLRVGQGFDVHAFSDDPERDLVLGGIKVTGERALAGHSDADVVTHALCDALLGAIGGGEIGLLFPDTDPTWEGVGSLELLEIVLSKLRHAGARTVNADCTVVCDRPRLAAHTAQMAKTLTSALGAPVGVKAKRAEGLGALGRGEGIACTVVALVELAGAGD